MRKKRFGLLGENLSHSFSPQIHAELGDYEYRLYEKRPDEIDDFLRHADFDGLNVTIPYKKTVIPYCAALSDTAKAIGSVNTLTRLEDGSLCGHNTDYYGFEYLLKKSKIDPGEGKVIILGSGGSSLTVREVLIAAAASEVVVISRAGADNYESINNHSDAIMIINTTPVGMYPRCGFSPLEDLGVFINCRAVIDIIYNPARTELLLQAEKAGMTAVGGLAMLSAQAKRAAELFCAKTIPDEIIEALCSKISGEMMNIILIGMPGCGKTTVGGVIAKKLGRKFFDTDAIVTKIAGKPIPDIFRENGEEVFRAMETSALREVCCKSGAVVATGGGVVTRPENLWIMRQNACIVFLDRDISQLPVSGRPLSMREGIMALAKERLPLYKKWSQHTARVSGVEQTADDIIRAFTYEHCSLSDAMCRKGVDA